MFKFPDFVRSGAAFVVVLGVLVFVHELGHYLAARWRGVHVEAFSIGFGRALRPGRTSAAPRGRSPGSRSAATSSCTGRSGRTTSRRRSARSWTPGGPSTRSPWPSRAIVVAAGPVANFVLAAVLFARSVRRGGPAGDRAGGRRGGRRRRGRARRGWRRATGSLAIDGAPTARFEDIQRIVAAHPGGDAVAGIRRGDADMTMPVTTGIRATAAAASKVGILGMRGGATEFEQLSPARRWPAA